VFLHLFIHLSFHDHRPQLAFSLALRNLKAPVLPTLGCAQLGTLVEQCSINTIYIKSMLMLQSSLLLSLTSTKRSSVSSSNERCKQKNVCQKEEQLYNLQICSSYTISPSTTPFAQPRHRPHERAEKPHPRHWLPPSTKFDWISTKSVAITKRLELGPPYASVCGSF
jgi:hypothetical protein